jgi:hypothetical protein
MSSSTPTKKFKEWTIQYDFLAFHCDQIKKLTAGDPIDDMQRVNIYRSLFDFMTDPVNNEFMALDTTKGIMLIKLSEIYKNPIYDRIKESTDKLCKSLSMTNEEIDDLFVHMVNSYEKASISMPFVYAANFNCKKTIQKDFIKFHIEQINKLQPEDPQRINLNRSLFDFMADPANREFIKKFSSVRAGFFDKIDKIREKRIYDPIKNSIDRLHNILADIEKSEPEVTDDEIRQIMLKNIF